jgi:hypothetical protein
MTFAFCIAVQGAFELFERSLAMGTSADGFEGYGAVHVERLQLLLL